MARGHHYRPAEAHMGDKAMRANGGKIPEESEGKMQSYTAKPNNVEDEAEGTKRKRGGRRADGGHVVDHDDEAKEGERKHGGRAKKHVEGEGEKTKHRRLDRPGRKRGGGVGATEMPLSSAARTRPAEAHKADADELAE